MKFRIALWSALFMLWLGGVVAGLAWLAAYSHRPGDPATSPAEWPSSSRIERDRERPTLLMFVHPRCACSRASVAELAELVARAAVRPRTCVVFLRPKSVADEWGHTELWSTASKIPDAKLFLDEGGDEARRFGARTSGQALLYGADGRLLFAGGLTASRGHPGDNAGRAAILALLDQEPPAVTRTPVFGCELFDSDETSSNHESTECCSDAK